MMQRLIAQFGVAFFLLLSLPVAASSLPQLQLQIGQSSADHHVYIETTFTGHTDGVSQISFSEWGGLTELNQDIIQLAITASEGPQPRFRKADEGQGWLIQHQPNQKLTVSYAIPPNIYQQEVDSRAYYRPMVSAELTHLIGHTSLLLPNHYNETIWLDFQWDDTAGRQTFSSITGYDSVRLGSISRADLSGALFIIGAINIAERSINGLPIFISLQDGEWPFELELLADLTERIAQAERAYFADYDFPFFWVSAIAAGQPMTDGYQFSGTLLANNFSLFLNPSTQFEFDLPTGSPIVFLLAHEMMHVWIGSKLAPPVGSAPGAVAWFTEGFTNYFTQQVLLHSEILTREQYQKQLKEVFTDLQNNPQIAASNQAIADNFWASMDYQLLPYQRGQLIAAYVDAKLENTSLKALLQQWLADPAWHNGVGIEPFLKAVRPYLSTAAYAATERFIVAGELPADLREVLFHKGDNAG